MELEELTKEKDIKEACDHLNREGILELLVAAVDQLRKEEMKWRPYEQTKEEAGEIAENVLLTTRRGENTNVGVYRGDRMNEYSGFLQEFGWGITAWMPMPTPYKGGKK